MDTTMTHTTAALPLEEAEEALVGEVEAVHMDTMAVPLVMVDARSPGTRKDTHIQVAIRTDARALV